VTPDRSATLQQFKTALAKAEAVCVVLRLAVDELETQDDERILANVTTFATNFTVRQAADIHRAVSGTP
jgi:hypothetical protein